MKKTKMIEVISTNLTKQGVDVTKLDLNALLDTIVDHGMIIPAYQPENRIHPTSGKELFTPPQNKWEK